MATEFVWTWAWIIGVIGLLALIIAQAAIKKVDTRKKLTWLGLIAMGVGLVSIGGFFSFLAPLNQPIQGAPPVNIPLLIQGNQQIVSSTGGDINTYQPTVTYSTQDKFSTTSVSGTAYYKSNGLSAGTTAITNTDPSTSYEYWISNGTYYVKPITFTGGGTKNIVNKESYNNGSITVTGYDLVQKQSINSGAYNSSMGANKDAKIELTVIGSAKTAALPFGGVMVVEFNSTIPTAACSGDGIVGSNSKYQVTYSPAATTTRYLVYEVANGFDLSKDGGNTGVTNVIRCDFTNGATPAGAGATWYVKFIPANYYLTNTGTFALDVEQKENGATTRTGYSTPTSTFYWGT